MPKEKSQMVYCMSCGERILPDEVIFPEIIGIGFTPRMHRNKGSKCRGGSWKAYDGDIYGDWKRADPVWTPY